MHVRGEIRWQRNALQVNSILVNPPYTRCGVIFVVAQAFLRVKYFMTQLGVRKEFANKSAMDVEAAIEDLKAQEKTLRANKVCTLKCLLYGLHAIVKL